MLVFCDGIAGCGENEYLDRFQQLCEQEGKEVEVFKLGEKILEVGRRDYPDLGKYDLMRFPRSTVSAWRAAAFESLTAHIDDSKVYIVDAHASFWVKNGPKPAINTSYLRKLDPDMFVQFIDYEPAIHRRLNEAPDLPEEQKLSLDEVIRWQEVERYTNRILSDHHQKPFYTIASQHPERNLFDLVFEDSDRPTVYQSFPITNLSEEGMEQVQEHVAALRDHATVFDPIEIDPAEVEGQTQKLLNNHTVKRDQQFIDQADMVVVYFPEMVYSSGVEYEINYASRTGKPVWIIKPEGYVGPFTDYNCDREFSSTEECLEALEAEFGGRNDG